MNLYSIEGPMGNGKSTTLAMLAYWWQVNEGRKIISNMPLTIPYTDFSLEYLKAHLYDNEIGDCVVLWDEGNQLADAHCEASPVNRVLSMFTGQTRKRKVDLLISVHKLDYLGRRLRIHILSSGLRGYSKCIKEKPCLKCKGFGLYKGELCDRCLGFTDKDTPRDDRTFVAHIYPTFWNRRRHWTDFWVGKGELVETNAKRIPMEYIGNYYFNLFDTEKKIPARKSYIENMETAEIGV